jgi:hypothetical protein
MQSFFSKNFLKVIIVVLCFGLFFNVQSVFAQNKKIKAKTADIPAGNCYLTAKIVKVYKKIDKSTPNMPCGKVPCIAKVEIMKVEGYGPGFYGALEVAQQIKVQFMLTLQATDKGLFPGMKQRYPGLNKGDVFTAYLKSYMLPKDREVYYTVADYKLGRL